MRGIRIKVNKGIVSGGFSDLVLIGEGDDPLEELRESVIQALATDIEITISGVTMHLAAWCDPEHWSDDWAKHTDEGATDYVLSLLSDAIEVSA